MAYRKLNTQGLKAYDKKVNRTYKKTNTNSHYEINYIDEIANKQKMNGKDVRINIIIYIFEK